MVTITEVPDTPPTRETKAKRERKPSGAVQAYLTVYNLTLGAAWAYVLYLTVTEYLATDGDVNKVYNRVELPLQIAQTAAVMEVLHVLFGFVRSSLLITFIQVTSRVVILWGIGYAFPEVRGHWSFVTMVISWAITEIVRYNFYVMPTNPVLLYLRYTLFYILYPTGAGSEWIFAYQTIPLLTPPVLYVIYALLFLYFPLFPKQYFHMISQRRKTLFPRKDKKTE